jgi:rhodanese-related sulfurtransferase
VTDFVAGLGTCGTITGTGRFLKEQSQAVRVIGVHPAEGHDIPGVRSLRQLKQTELFFPDEYDGLVEIDNEEAFGLCRRLNQEESIIAGPSSGMALAGAFKRVPDEPGRICVIIFPDNAFKYTTSFKKHLPELFPGASAPAAPGGVVAEILGSLVTHAKSSPDLMTVDEAADLVEKDGTRVIDVRTAPEYEDEHIRNAANIPLEDLVAGTATGLPEDRSTPILTVCAVGEKSLYAMLVLKALGYEKVKNLIGGMNAWVSDGRETEGVYS